MTSPSTSCILDPIPTWLTKKCIDSLLPAVTLIVNSALGEGLPTEWETAVVRPLFKKGSSDPENLSSYRPVSNLPFLSKVIERVVVKRLVSFLQHNGRLNPYQHATGPSTPARLLLLVCLMKPTLLLTVAKFCYLYYLTSQRLLIWLIIHYFARG